MLPAVASEKEGDELGALGGGAPQTPAGGRRPLAPPACRFRYLMYAACGGQRERGNELGITCPPDPAELLSFLALVDLIETDGSRH